MFILWLSTINYTYINENSRILCVNKRNYKIKNVTDILSKDMIFKKNMISILNLN